MLLGNWLVGFVDVPLQQCAVGQDLISLDTISQILLHWESQEHSLIS